MSAKGDDAQEIPPAAGGVCRDHLGHFPSLELGSNLGIRVAIKQIPLSFRMCGDAQIAAPPQGPH